MSSSKCMIPRCHRLTAVGRRGLCLVCFSRAKAKVEAGEVTWDELAKVGLCQAEDDLFDAAFEEATKATRRDNSEFSS